MTPSVPPSEEVAREHVRRCGCDSCALWRRVADVIENGTPQKRRALLRSLLAATDQVAHAVVKDVLE